MLIINKLKEQDFIETILNAIANHTHLRTNSCQIKGQSQTLDKYITHYSYVKISSCSRTHQKKEETTLKGFNCNWMQSISTY